MLAAMEATELAARRYIDAWFEADRERRAALLAACFAERGRIVVRGQVMEGRAALAVAIEAFRADPRKLTMRMTSAIDATGQTFRFRALFAHPDGRPFNELVDIGEVDRDGRIAALYTFVEPLAAGVAPIDPASPAALAAQRYIDVWSERDPAARQALLEACFAPSGRIVARKRTFDGRDEVAAMIDATFAHPQGFTAGRTSAIEAAGSMFRFATVFSIGDGAPLEGEDAGEIDGDGRIAVLYPFVGPLPRA
jgi:hypothetical protein